MKHWPPSCSLVDSDKRLARRQVSEHFFASLFLFLFLCFIFPVFNSKVCMFLPTIKKSFNKITIKIVLYISYYPRQLLVFIFMVNICSHWLCSSAQTTAQGNTHLQPLLQMQCLYSATRGFRAQFAPPPFPPPISSS